MTDSSSSDVGGNAYVNYAKLHVTPFGADTVGAPLRKYAESRAGRHEGQGGRYYTDRSDHSRYTGFAKTALAQAETGPAGLLTPNVPRGWSAYSPAWRDSLIEGALDVERDNLEKCGNYFRHHPEGYELFTTSLHVPDIDMDEDVLFRECWDLLQFLGKRGLEALADTDGTRADIPIRMDAQGGWPANSPGTAKDEKLSLLAYTVGEQMDFLPAQDALRKATRRLHEGKLGADPCVLRYTRVSGARPQKGWPACTNELALRRLRVWTDHASAKHRAVFAFGMFANSYIFGFQRTLYEFLHAWPMFPDTIDDAVEHLADCRDEGLEDIPEDISSFDQSIAPQHQRAMLRALEKYSPTLALWSRYMNQWELRNIPAVFAALRDWPVVTQAFIGTDRAAVMLFDRLGGQPSGNQITSTFGSLINCHRLVSKYAHIRGITFKQALAALERREWSFVLQSDDTCLALPKGMRAEWDALKWMGYSTTTQGAPVFLQRQMDLLSRTHWGVASRLWDSTINREEMNEPTTQPVALLGIAARLKLLEGGPFSSLYDRMMLLDPRTERALHLAKAEPLAVHEARVAEQLRTGGRSPNVESLLGLYGGEVQQVLTSATATGRQLAMALTQVSYLRLGQATELASRVGTSALPQLAGKRLGIYRRH